MDLDRTYADDEKNFVGQSSDDRSKELDRPRTWYAQFMSIKRQQVHPNRFSDLSASIAFYGWKYPRSVRWWSTPEYEELILQQARMEQAYALMEYGREQDQARRDLLDMEGVVRQVVQKRLDELGRQQL